VVDYTRLVLWSEVIASELRVTLVASRWCAPSSCTTPAVLCALGERQIPCHSRIHHPAIQGTGPGKEVKHTLSSGVVDQADPLFGLEGQTMPLKQPTGLRVGNVEETQKGIGAAPAARCK
jgi:hypothetical protein